MKKPIIKKYQVTLDYNNRDWVSGRWNNIHHLGSEKHKFIDANILGIRQGNVGYRSELNFFKEPQWEYPDRILFTIYDEILQQAVGELEVNLGTKRIRWIKPYVMFRISPYQLDLEIVQDMNRRTMENENPYV